MQLSPVFMRFAFPFCRASDLVFLLSFKQIDPVPS